MLHLMRKLCSLFLVLSLSLPTTSLTFAQENDANATPEEVAFSRIATIVVVVAADRAGLNPEAKKQLSDDVAAIQAIHRKASKTDEDRKQLREGLTRLTPVLSSLLTDYRADAFALGEGLIEGFTQTDLDKIRKVCGDSLEYVLKAVAKEGEAKSFADEARARAEECQKYVTNAIKIFEKQLAALAEAEQKIVEELNELNRQYEAANTPEKKQEVKKKIDEKVAELKETREKKKRVEEVKGKVDWGKVILGVVVFAVGVVVAVYGDPNTGAVLMSAGGAMVEEAGKPKSEKRDVVDETVKTQRDGLEPQKAVDNAKATELLDEYKAAGYEVLSGGNQGNVMVFRDASDKSWVVMQIDPRVLIDRIAPSLVTIQPNGPVFTSLDELTDVSVKTVDSSNGVALKFNAKLGGTDVSGGMIEQGVGSKSYALTLDTAFNRE